MEWKSIETAPRDGTCIIVDFGDPGETFLPVFARFVKSGDTITDCWSSETIAKYDCWVCVVNTDQYYETGNEVWTEVVKPGEDPKKDNVFKDLVKFGEGNN